MLEQSNKKICLINVFTQLFFLVYLKVPRTSQTTGYTVIKQLYISKLLYTLHTKKSRTMKQANKPTHKKKPQKSNNATPPKPKWKPSSAYSVVCLLLFLCLVIILVFPFFEKSDCFFSIRLSAWAILLNVWFGAVKREFTTNLLVCKKK